MIRLDNKVVIVTGAASGIGLGTAEVLVDYGASVVLADINGEAAETAAAGLRDKGAAAVAVKADVSDEDEVRNMIDVAVREFGGLDALHNNAALVAASILAQDVDIVDINPDIFRQVLSVNLIGVALGAKYAIPHLISRGGGAIINTASVTGNLSEHTRAMYGSSKAAVIGFTRNIATQYGKQGVRANSISPGLIVTPALKAGIPQPEIDRLVKHALLPRPGHTSDIGNLVAFLASDAGSYITGVDIPVDGGLTAHWPTYAEELDARNGA